VIDGGILASEIEGLGFRVTVLKAYDHRWLAQYSAREILRLRRMLKDGDYDIVHTHLFQADVAGRIAARLAGVPIVVKTLHNMGRWKAPWQIALDRLLARWTDRVICVSDYQRQEVLAQERESPERVLTIPNGVDISRFSPVVDREAYMRDLGLKPDMRIVGTVGRLIEEKGHIHLLKAIPLILREHPDTQFLIVGDGRLKTMLTGVLEGNPFEDRVKFAGLRPDVAELLSLMDVFVFPSLSEGFPIAPIEAMAARRPVAASSIPQLKGVVMDGDTGLSFPPSDEAALAAAVCRLLGDAGLRERLVRNAFNLVSSTYSEARMVRTTEELYVTLLEEAEQRATPGRRAARAVGRPARGHNYNNRHTETLKR
jgi:glycosyltransferase involved in cell wall biosynthesis